MHKKVLSELGVTFYFLGTPRDDAAESKSDGNGDGDESLWSHCGTMLQLRYDHGAEQDADLKINNGNIEPHRGFGHIAFNVDDVYAHCEVMDKNGASFKKKPDEGRMKGLAFAMDPNSYWIEVVKRSEKCNFKIPCNLSQTMLRIKNPEESLKFYCDLLGMRLVTERHFERGKFSLYFLSSFVDDVDIDKLSDEERYHLMKTQFHPVLELTHNWGTEADDNFEYHTGNEMCDLGQGFVSISFLVNDLKEAVQRLKENGAEFKPLPKYMEHKEGTNGFTFLLDPDDYTVEILQRGESPVNPHPEGDDQGNDQ